MKVLTENGFDAVRASLNSDLYPKDFYFYNFPGSLDEAVKMIQEREVRTVAATGYFLMEEGTIIVFAVERVMLSRFKMHRDYLGNLDWSKFHFN